MSNVSDRLKNSYKWIPCFYKRGDSSIVALKFNEIVREEFFQFQESKLLDEDELKDLSSIFWNALRLSESLDSSGSLNDSTKLR
ncbi:Hypothetical protein NTJ_10870 [Nesidiocoris tenuis]|uniref:Uncharacterized protein n=1 Tax=Nesidiocoris tenuis TaxID=355587 RepID=A0ABN7B4E7_9HEMI|nr:Hypothetical protein NTJ_10870 [Nesidiocoris tenuis]